MSQIPAPSPELREQAAAALAPFFMTGTDGETQAAQEAAAATLEDYAPMTPKELQLAAQSVAFSFAALACLGAAAMVRTEDLDMTLDLQESALAMDALADKNTRALEARQRERQRAPHLMSAANTQWDNAAFRKAIARALEKMLYADTKLAALHQKAAATTSPAAPEPEKLSVLSAEPMTLSLLARRGTEAAAVLGKGSRTRQ
jgi:hypothetical protein